MKTRHRSLRLCRIRVADILVVVFLTMLTTVTTGCGSKKLGRSNLGTTIGKREVKTSLDGGAFISSQGDNAIVTFGGGKLVVEKASLQLNGKELTTFSEDAKKVEIDYTAGRLTIIVDGQDVLTTELKK